MANSKHRVQTLEDCTRWIAQHGGEIDERWRHQDLLNEHVDRDFEKIFERIDTLATRLAWATGAAAMLGAVITLAVQVIWGLDIGEVAR